MAKQPKLGSGKQFKNLSHKLAKEGASYPDAAAAAIGRKKHGGKKMASLAKKGRQRHQDD